MSKSKIFFYSCLAFIAGIGSASFLPESVLSYELHWFVAGILFLTSAAIFHRQRKNKDKSENGLSLAPLLLVLAFFFFGLWRYALSMPVNSSGNIQYYNGYFADVTGLITGEPDVREASQRLEITVKSIEIKGKTDKAQKADGKLLVATALYPQYKYGDVIRTECELMAPEPFDDFAYDRYLARYNVYAVCYYPKVVETVGSGQGNRLVAGVLAIKNKMKHILNRGLDELPASLARAMLLGDKRGLPEDVREAFSCAGLSHLAAISGMHISIISAMVMTGLIYLGFRRRQAYYLATLFLLFYIILIGLPASAIRAGIMGFLVLTAMELGRLNRAVNSLVLAAAVMLLMNPRLLRDDIGFQLSFAAVAGLVFFYPLGSALYRRLEDRFSIPTAGGGVAAILLVTISAQLATWPLTAYYFSSFTWVAPMSNLVVLWVLPFLFVSLVGGLVIAFFLPGFGYLALLPARLILDYIIAVARYAAAFAGNNEYRTGWLFVAVYYALFGILWISMPMLKKIFLRNRLFPG